MPIVIEIFTQKGTVYYFCGMCLVPSLEQTQKIKNRSGIISIPPRYIIKEGQSGKRHGPKQSQYDHWKAKDETIAVKKRNF